MKPEVVEQLLLSAERLATSSLRGRELSVRDIDRFGQLWSDSAEVLGEWLVVVERGPDPLAQFRLQDAATITVIEDFERGGEIVACMTWSTINVFVGGRPVSVGVAHALRVAGSRRREGLGDLVRTVPRRALMRPFQAQLMYMRLDNDGVAKFLDQMKFVKNEGRRQSEAIVHHLHVEDRPSDPRVRLALPADLAVCAGLINRVNAGLDLYAPLTPEALDLRLREGFWGGRPPEIPFVYGWSDFHVLEIDGRVVACGGLWDRGRDIREIWRSRTTGEERIVDYAAVLDFGWDEGAEEVFGDLLRDLSGQAARRGRGALAVPLAHAPGVLEGLTDLTPRQEVRIQDWTSFGASAPMTLGPAHIDMRHW
jgi:hypothetical protein